MSGRRSASSWLAVGLAVSAGAAVSRLRRRKTTHPPAVREHEDTTHGPDQERPPPDGDRHSRLGIRWALLLVSTGLFATALVLRVRLYADGKLYGDSALHNYTLLLAGLLVTVGVSAFSLRRARGGSDLDAVAWVGGVLALGATALGVVGSIVPEHTTQIALPPCEGVSVLGAPFFAQTTGDSLYATTASPTTPSSAGPAATPGTSTPQQTPGEASLPPGVSARSGPGLTYPPVDRFAGDCTLGFDGYCIGDPVEDKLSQIADSRWLVVHGRDHEYVSAAEVLFQSPFANLRSAVPAHCERGGKVLGSPAPEAPRFTPELDAATGDVKLEATARYARVLGYSLNQFAPTDGSLAYQPLGRPLQNPFGLNDRFTGDWPSTSSYPALSGGSGEAELAATACLAEDAPVLPPAVFRVRFAGGKAVSIVPSHALSTDDAERLGRAACESAP